MFIDPTQMLHTLFNPTRTFMSQYAIRATNANGYMVTSSVSLVDVTVKCNSADYTVTQPITFPSTLTFYAAATQTI